jgi:hypothetical protein
VDVSELDSILNAGCLATFGEAVTFTVGGTTRSARAVFELPVETEDLGLAPVQRPLPALLMPLDALRTVAAREGDTVLVRGVRYTLMDGVDDPLADAGGMARIAIRAYG